MEVVRVQCPAKINLNLEVLGKRSDGFHNIKSIMQTINLYDYLTIEVEEAEDIEIVLSGNSDEIPYDESNLVYKAIKIFLESKIYTPKKVVCYIEKNIPVSAGLAGGSTDAAGVIYGLNKLLLDKFSEVELHELCASLGSDLNVCLQGGRLLCKGRGEIIERQEFKELNLSLIKPINLGISAKEAYTKFSHKISQKLDIETRKMFSNDLEWAIIKDYKELQFIKEKYPTAKMTGSGSTYFSLSEVFEDEQGYWVKNGLKTIKDGVKLI